MATLLLQVAGAAVGGMVGGPLGAAVGRAAGGLAGAAIDQRLFGSSDGGKTSEGPRLTDIGGLTSTEGAPVPRLYGRARIGGELIWATRVLEVPTVSAERSGNGSKGLGSSSTSGGTTYAYYANIAVGLCEGPVALVRRIWADGKEIDRDGIVMRLHNGAEDQPPDPLIVAKEGAENAPAYRGLAYVVFERLPLAGFGNRVPQFTFEVVRPVAGLGHMIRAVDLIPGASEFAYDPAPRIRVLAPGVSDSENRHQLFASSDAVASLDALVALCPNLERVALVVSWFGTDLRAGQCRCEPRVEGWDKATTGDPWTVGGLGRVLCQPVSRVDGRPAYGGTPADHAVIRLIAELRGRGIEVALYPFLMMDVPADNDLPDPHSGEAGQPAYPWRGRVTCEPAPGRPGSPDGTAGAVAQVAAFFGTALPGHFLHYGSEVLYLGPPEWSFRRLVLHYAHLAVVAGGVSGFVIGSELVGLTRVRGAAGYPAVDALCSLAADVRSVLEAGTAIVYAADWTEYGAHVREGGAEVRFPLDPLWSSPDIDAVGIDFYPPLTDWRDGIAHADRDEARSIYDPAFLARSVGSGPDFDWYYASEADRLAQVRTPITDGACGKPWVFRAKDLANWWSNAHIERSGGVETTATAWVPCGKPIWLTEIGIPAVDKGTNGPNVFPDPKSSENAAPPLSNGVRDDLIQTRGLAAIITRFDPAAPGHDPAWNPLSPVYGGRMVDAGHIFVWAWDARPYPAFPDLAGVWADGGNWRLGHWVTGRVEGVTLDALVAAILADHGEVATSLPLDGFLDGYVIDRAMSARDALEPLAALFGFEVATGPDGLRCLPRAGDIITLGEDDLVRDEDGRTVSFRRGHDADLPREVRVGFTDPENDYRRAAVASRRLPGGIRRQTAIDAAIVTRRGEAERLADARLHDLWTARETASFLAGPRRLDLEPGDLVRLPGVGQRLYRVTRLGFTGQGTPLRIEAKAIDPDRADVPAGEGAARTVAAPRLPGPAFAVVLDLPAAPSGAEVLAHLAVFADPWPGRVAILRSADGSRFDTFATAELSAIVGSTTSMVGPGSPWRIDRAGSFTASMRGGPLASVDDLSLLAGRNAFALLGSDGEAEVIGAGTVEVVESGTVRFSRLLRGLGGTEAVAARTLPVGATIVALDEALVPLATSSDDLGRSYRWRIGPAARDHADPSYIEIEAAAGGRALRPLAPVRPAARRGEDGIVLSFIRRTRTGGDGWEQVEVPLAEERELYEIDILSGSAVVRTLATGEPRALYPTAAELADFGTPQATITVRIAQMSARVGRGQAITAVLPIR